MQRAGRAHVFHLFGLPELVFKPAVRGDVAVMSWMMEWSRVSPE
jgi:hypothetical protein